MDLSECSVLAVDEGVEEDGYASDDLASHLGFPPSASAGVFVDAFDLAGGVALGD